jgi:hypothetical protein
MTTEFDTTTENTEAPEALGTIEYIDPETLELEANVRDDVQLAEDSWPACASTECSCP